MHVQLPNNYGYCFLVLGGSFFMNGYMTFLVIQARKKYNVEYPNLYAPETNKHKKEFDSVQRGHQNTLESYAIVMVQMMANGLVYPITSAVMGGLWVVGKIIYAAGYASNGPDGRLIGSLISHLGDLPLVGVTLKIAYDMIMANK